MIVGVPTEIKAEEYRVALTPVGVRELTVLWHLGTLGIDQETAVAVSFTFVLAQLLAVAASLVIGFGLGRYVEGSRRSTAG